MKIDIPRIRRKIYREYKELCHKHLEKPTAVKNLVFVIGCQRSGTTMLSKIFEADYHTKVYPEVSNLSTLDKFRRRFDSLPDIEKKINSNNIGTIICKPLVESQNIDKILDYFENGKAIWMYRHFKDVAASDLKMFGPYNGIENLKKLVNEDSNTWRSERISLVTKNLIKEHFDENMSPFDAAALFWYARNQIFFDLNLAKHEKVIMCQYETLVSTPENTMKKLYSFLHIEFPKKKIISEVHQGSIKKGKSLEISEGIETLCSELLSKLNDSFNNQFSS